MERCNELSVLLPRAMVIHGDASNQELLLQEGIGQVDVFASLTALMRKILCCPFMPPASQM